MSIAPDGRNPAVEQVAEILRAYDIWPFHNNFLCKNIILKSDKVSFLKSLAKGAITYQNILQLLLLYR
jgi:hypothetical protein